MKTIYQNKKRTTNNFLYMTNKYLPQINVGSYVSRNSTLIDLSNSKLKLFRKMSGLNIQTYSLPLFSEHSKKKFT